MSQSLLCLLLYNLIFFWKFYRNPYLLCTSEIASTFFPHWVWMGKELRRGVFPAQDDIYYKLPGSIPFLATFYPPNLIASYIGSFLKLDQAFRLYTYFIIGHYLLASLFAYYLFGNLFCALTLTYAGYCIKLQQPTIAYTLAWIPLAFKGGLLGAFGWGMSLLGGYYPVLVYVMPVILLLQPLSFIGGLFLASGQLLPFLGYFKRSIRNGQKVDKKFGRLPWWRLTDLFIPRKTQDHVNGVHYPEVAMYTGIAVLFIWQVSWWWIPIIFSSLVSVGVIPPFQRIPARALLLLAIAMAAIFSESSNSISLLILQGFLLLQNASIYPSFPFSQWWDKPSILYTKKPKMNNWPHLTGYLEGRSISDYRGSFRLA